METFKLSQTNVGLCAARAAEVLRAGGVVLYPTDTLYGLGADALSDEAVEKVYAIKNREARKPVHCVVASLETAEQYAEVNDFARMLAREFLPGPLTLILRKKGGVATGIARGIETIGIRIPNNDFCLALARKFGKPYMTTSANSSGKKAGRSVNDILHQLGDAADRIGLVIDAGELPETKPSTVIDVSGPEPVIIREGAVAAADIWNILRNGGLEQGLTG